MKFFLVFIFSIFSLMGSAQDSWKLILNDKAILSTSEENESKNVITIRSTALKTNKDFQLVYMEKPKQDKMDRTIMIVGDNDHELFSIAGTKLKIKNLQLEVYFKKSTTLRIYTVALPKDPKLKAMVRVRRIHLCTLVLK